MIDGDALNGNRGYTATTVQKQSGKGIRHRATASPIALPQPSCRHIHSLPPENTIIGAQPYYGTNIYMQGCSPLALAAPLLALYKGSGAREVPVNSHTQTCWTDGALKLKLAGQKDVYGTRRRKTISRGASIRHLLRGKLHWQGAAASFLRKKTRCSNGAFRGHFYNNSRNTHPFVLQYELYTFLC